MQVVQPYHQVEAQLLEVGGEPGGVEVAGHRARLPGARLVFTHGGVRRPRSTAFLASRPPPTITDGFEVLVQLVIAAIATEPVDSGNVSPFEVTSTGR